MGSVPMTVVSPNLFSLLKSMENKVGSCCETKHSLIITVTNVFFSLGNGHPAEATSATLILGSTLSHPG